MYLHGTVIKDSTPTVKKMTYYYYEVFLMKSDQHLKIDHCAFDLH